MSDAREEAELRYPYPADGPFSQVKSELNAARQSAFLSGVEWQAVQPVSSNGLNAAQEIERLSANWMGFVRIADELHDRVFRIRAAFAGQNVGLASKIADEDTPYEREPETRTARPAAPITDAQVEAATRAIDALDWSQQECGVTPDSGEIARAALEAAREVQE